MRDYALIYLNGRRLEVRGQHSAMMLSDFLRYERSLTGTKIVCAEGDCGACSVLRWFPFPAKKSAAGGFEAINSCIVTVAQLDGSSLVTIEGLADANGGKLTPVQEALVSCHGSQCGFCTPGFVVALTALVEKKIGSLQTDPIDVRTAQNYLTGNLCRCTGYTPILHAASTISLRECKSLTKSYLTTKIKHELAAAVKQPFEIASDEFLFHAPTTVTAATKFTAKHPGARILGAGTDLGVLSNKNKIVLREALSLHLISELYEIKEIAAKQARTKRLHVGARLTMAGLRRIAEKRIPELSRFLDLFASPQIKNVATLVGNVANGSPIADTIPALLALNATAVIYGVKGKRVVPLADFYLGYRKTSLRKGEWIGALEFDIPHPKESFSLFKSSQRKDLDISCVNAAYRITWTDGVIKQCRFAMGGVAAIPLRLKGVESFLEGKDLTPLVVAKAIDLAHREMTPLSDLRGSSAYRRVVTENLLLKFFNLSQRGKMA